MDKSKLAHDLLAVAEALKTLAEGLQEDPKEDPPVTLEQVRGVLADKSRAGHTAEVKEIISRYGAEKLSAVDPVNFPAILKAAEGLNDE